MTNNIRSLVDFFDLYIKNFSDITIFDVIDILLVAYVIYVFSNWARDTRSWSLIKGIFILVIMWIFFLAFNLGTMAWIISNIFKVGGWVAAIILFQPELRKALEELGKGSFLVSDKGESTETNKEIIKALKTLSKNYVGALICIEQNIALGEYEKTGILIDGIITSQLLLNVFVDKTPLHDGAVIIRKNRLAAAGCILPVTSAEIGKELGTRHRAGVGISEVSDAIVIIASEELGKVSVARGGKLFRNLTYVEIFDMLQRSINGDKYENKSFLRRMFSWRS